MAAGDDATGPVTALAWVGQQGRYCLILGLLVGLFAPALAEMLRPWVGTLVALLLFVTGVRVGARQAFGSLGALLPSLIRIVLMQVAAPLVAIAAFTAAGVMEAPLALAVALMLAAPSLTGAPNFAVMLGQDPTPGMRILVLSTALFPLTAFPVLWVLDPTGGGALDALFLSFGLLTAILVAVGAGFALRRGVPALGNAGAQGALDGVAAILLAVVVVGLMSAVGPLLRADPLELAMWMGAATAINFGLVLATWRVAPQTLRLPTAIYAGNRNIALFLITLPAEVAAPLMIFVGCYQVPMYLTPILLARLTASMRA